MQEWNKFTTTKETPQNWALLEEIMKWEPMAFEIPCISELSSIKQSTL